MCRDGIHMVNSSSSTLERLNQISVFYNPISTLLILSPLSPALQHLHPAANHQHREAARLCEGEPVPGGAGADGARAQRGAAVRVHLPAAAPWPAGRREPGEHRLGAGFGSVLRHGVRTHNPSAAALHQVALPARSHTREHCLRQASAVPAGHAAVEERCHGALCGARSVREFICVHKTIIRL